MRRKIYFAGELFSLKHLAGNAMLAKSIYDVSGGVYCSVLPQMLEQRETTELSVRNQDLRQLMACDVGVFNFDGDEIDSGTVVEYMVAKFIDMPTVIVRSDFRAQSDSKVAPWNLMISFYPRTKTLVVDGMECYQQQISPYEKDDYAAALESGLKAAEKALETLAGDIVSALDEVCAEPSLLTSDRRKAVFEWMMQMPGGGFEQSWTPEMLEVLQQRIDKP